MGMFGAGLALSIANTIQSLFLYLCLYIYDEMKEIRQWPKYDEEQWRYIKQYLVIGFPAMLMGFLEIAGVEVFQPLSGLISPLANGAQAIVMNLYACLFTCYLGTSIATAIFVGNSTGEGNVPQARRYAQVAQMAIVGCTCVLSLLLFIFKDSICSSFSSSTAIISLAAPALTVLAMALVPDSIIYAQVGILRGLGKQKLAATI